VTLKYFEKIGNIEPKSLLLLRSSFKKQHSQKTTLHLNSLIHYCRASSRNKNGKLVAGLLLVLSRCEPSHKICPLLLNAHFTLFYPSLFSRFLACHYLFYTTCSSFTVFFYDPVVLKQPKTALYTVIPSHVTGSAPYITMIFHFYTID
jgi:hypothetical protein